MLDLKTAYRWLNRFGAPHLGPEARIILDSAHLAGMARDRAALQTLIDDMRYRPGITWTPEERADLWIQVGLTASELNLNPADVYLFQEVVAIYAGYLHQYPWAEWMLGCIYWKYPAHRNDAVHACQRGLDALKDLVYRFVMPDPGWYQEKYNLMRQVLYRSVARWQYVPDPMVPGWQYVPDPMVPGWRTPPAPPAPGPTPPARPPVSPYPSRRPRPPRPQPRVPVQIFPVHSSVPAGGWGAVSDKVTGYVSLDELVIDGVRHTAGPLRGQGRIDAADGNKYRVVRVKGTSMNQAGIDDGDYVLIRVVASADHMDIVLAEQFGIDNEATLKRFIKQGGVIELWPESDDPAHTPPVIETKFEIRGIATAVFKPKT